MQIYIDQNTLTKIQQLADLRNQLNKQDPAYRMATWSRIDNLSSEIAFAVQTAVEGRLKAG